MRFFGLPIVLRVEQSSVSDYQIVFFGGRSLHWPHSHLIMPRCTGRLLTVRVKAVTLLPYLKLEPAFDASE
jgi:hypothetical protein